MIRLPQLVLLGVGLSALTVAAQSPGKFVATGNMTVYREFHTATLLKDGRVLITGGSLGLDARASAELYDPSTGTFTPTGNMTTSRQWHTATLLSDGRVLIVGGPLGAGRVTNSSEVYDPATGLFTRTGDMTAPQGWLTANLLLGNGKVLISGDQTAEFYDPATGIFTLAGPADSYPSGSWNRSTLLLQDGRVLVIGKDSISLYDALSNSLRLAASLPGSYPLEATATLLSNGKVLISGGGSTPDYDVTLNEASIYDAHRGAVESTGLMLFSRSGHTATLLPGGHVLIVGGYDGDGYDTGIPSLTDAEDYAPPTGSFTSAGSLVHLREGHTATPLPDGTVLIAGGNYATAAELYIPPLRAASSASLNGPLAPGSLASLFGSRLATTTESADPLLPPISLGGIRLRLRDSSGTERFVPLLYVSPTQINFEVPAWAAPGNVSLQIDNALTEVATTVAQVTDVAPGLFSYDDNTAIAYALRFEPNGKQTVLSVRNTIVLDDRPVYLILYATGIRNRSSVANVRCTIGGISVPVEYAGAEGSGVPGLDQVNIRLTSALKGTGLANLVLTVDGVAANTVSVDIR